MGVESATSTYSSHESYLAYKSGTSIIRLNGPEFSSIDIGKTFYWTQADVSEAITGTGTYISSASTISNSSLSSTHTLTTGGTYTGTTTKNYVIQIDLVSTTPNKFKWSNDGGKTFEAEYVDITSSAITLESGITVTFSTTTGYGLNNYFTFTVGPTLTVTASATYSTQEAYTLKPNMSYLVNETNTDLKLGTSGLEKVRLTASGNFGINTQQPLSTLHVSNRNHSKYLVNTTTSGNQIHPNIAKLINGGYVVVWESINAAETNYDIYGQIYYPDGQKNGNEFVINNTTSNHQAHPFVAANTNTTYGGFIVVWASEESGNDGVYDIRGQIFDETNDDGSRAIKDFDLEINQSTSYNQKYPTASSLSNGDYIVVWESDDSNTGNSNVYAQKVTRLGNLSGAETQINSTTTYSQNYPVVAGLSADDATVSGGFVVAFMSEYDDDGAFDIKYRIFTSAMVAHNSVDVSVTSGTTKTYGRCNILGLDDGGFTITYFSNYYADVTNYDDGETVTSSDGTTAVIEEINSSYRNKLHVTTISPGGLFHTDALVTGSNTGNVEQVESVSSTSTIFTLASGDREITFSDNIINLIMLKYATSSTTAAYTVSSVNTTPLVDYGKLLDTDPTAYTRDYTIFDYKKPRPSISQLNNDNIIVGWNNGNTPTIYYQKLNVSTGAKVGDEINVNPDMKGIIEYNPNISSIVSHNKMDAGFVIVWQSEAIDHSSEGVYMMKVDDDNYLVRASNGATEWTVTNDAKMGLGVEVPLSQLHVKSAESYMTLQNTGIIKGNCTSDSKIKILDGNSSQLAEIKACYHNYNSPHLYGANLELWYRFEETTGMTTTDQSSRSNTGTLRNFDLKTHRVDGIIGNALRFDGVDSYIDCGDNSTITAICESDFAVSIWFKFPSTLATGTYNLINNGTSGNGWYYININTSNTLTAYFSSGATVTITGSTTVNDGAWHNVIFTHDSSNTTVYLYLDGSSEGNDTTTSPFSSKSDENVYIGATGGSSNYFTGVIDDVRIYDTYLSSTQVTYMYDNTNNTIGRLILKTNDGSGNFYDEINSVIIDQDSQFRTLHVKGLPSVPTTGTISSSGTTVTGTSTLFSQEYMIGDQLDISGTRTTILSIESDTSITGSETISGSDTTPIRYPSVLCVRDFNDSIKLLMDDLGNCGLGESNPATLFHMKGTTPYLSLENSTTESTDEGREGRIVFKGLNSSTVHDIAQIEGSHDGTGSDTKGKLKFSTNTGSALTETMTIDNEGHLYLGSSYSSTDAHVEIDSGLNQNCNVMITNDIQNTTGIGTRLSNLYFQNAEAATGESDLETACYAKITGSSDSANANIIGRLDFYTNNEDTLVPYMTMKNDGKIGLGGIDEPVNEVHMSVVYNTTGTASQSTTTVTGSGVSFSNVTVGSIIVFTDNSSAIITAVPTSSTLTVATSQTVSSQSFKIYYPGTSLNSSGKLLVNTTTSHGAYLHVDGNLSSKVSTISADTTIDASYSMILGDTSSGNVTLTLPAVSGNTGLQYTVKKISASNTLTLDGDGSETIDGSATVAITTNNVAVRIVCNGSAWYIMGHFDGSL
jgi:hypothetical protein